MDDESPTDAASALCASCGMCCNGDLFHSAVLQAEDKPADLKTLGIKLHEKRGAIALLQPCQAHTGSACGIYALRPRRCRLFVCRLLSEMLAGRKKPPVAYNTIAQARSLRREILQLLDALGEKHSKRRLSRRYESIRDRPADEPGTSAAALRGRLDEAMAAFEAFLDAEFRPPSGKSAP